MDTVDLFLILAVVGLVLVMLKHTDYGNHD